jgi:hypothetical protein
MKKPLIETNPYLEDKDREKLIEKSVVSSCGVEWIKIGFKDLKETPKIKIPRRNKKIYKKAG